MKTLMILGAGILQLPAIQKAKAMDLTVIAVDRDKNAIGFGIADICVDISTIDTEKILEVAKMHKIDGIMTLASDMPTRAIAEVAKELSIPGISVESAYNATDKALMRMCLQKSKVAIPAFLIVNSYKDYLNAIDKFTGKIVIKPADNSGSRGVFLIDTTADAELIEYAYNYSLPYSRSGELVIEEYMEGHEVSVETLSISGVVNVIAITDKITTGPPKFVEMGHSQPSRLNEKEKSLIVQTAIAAVKAIGIQDGPSHTEIIVTSSGPKIVEIGARLGGDNITTHLVPLSTGIDMVKCCIEIALGVIPDISPQWNRGSAIKYFPSEIGLIENIRNVSKASKIKGVKQISFVKQIGDYTHSIDSSMDRIGFVISEGGTADAALEVCKEAIEIIDIRIGNNI